MTKKSYTAKDYSKEKSTYGWNTEPLLANGSNLVAIQVASGTLNAAIKDVCLFINNTSQSLSETQKGSSADNLDLKAQREDKWLVTYEDTTEWLDAPADTIPNPGFRGLFHVELPMADLLLRGNTSEVVYTLGGVTTNALFTPLVAAFNSVVRSPYGGVAEVQEIRSVGRNT
jgi:hypothetical protein